MDDILIFNHDSYNGYSHSIILEDLLTLIAKGLSINLIYENVIIYEKKFTVKEFTCYYDDWRCNIINKTQFKNNIYGEYTKSYTKSRMVKLISIFAYPIVDDLINNEIYTKNECHLDKEDINTNLVTSIKMHLYDDIEIDGDYLDQFIYGINVELLVYKNIIINHNNFAVRIQKMPKQDHSPYGLILCPILDHDMNLFVKNENSLFQVDDEYFECYEEHFKAFVDLVNYLIINKRLKFKWSTYFTRLLIRDRPDEGLD